MMDKTMFARVEYRKRIYYAFANKTRLSLLKDSIFDDRPAKVIKDIDMHDARILAPVTPSKIVCVGLNYKDHAKELGMDVPEQPIIFLKPPSAVIGPGDNIVYPKQCSRLEYEAELAVIIKKQARSITQDEVRNYVLGYTCLNDITARDIQKKDIQWTRAKSFDSFCPVGPFIDTSRGPENRSIKLFVNKKIMQSSSTKEMIFDVPYLISFISHTMTLMPGDIVTTGTPKGVGQLKRGDLVCVEVQGVGSLINRVA
jgi:2-keto-4-pentenoate hydratase/2-oxohepta-3-ene-1,7-dioic acid hydratase in catechol pathway